MLANRSTFFVKQHAALLKLTGAYDILDPETKTVIGSAIETPPTWAKFLRLLVNKSLLPTSLVVTEAGKAAPYLTLHKKPAFFTQRVIIENGNGQVVGQFQTKAFTLKVRLPLTAPDGRALGELQGDWKAWDFTFKDPAGRELGRITKKWAGLGKELFTTADSYMIAASDTAAALPNAGLLLLAAGLSIDLALKESSG